MGNAQGGDSRVGEGRGHASERGVVHRKRAGQEACKSVGRASQLVTSQVPPGQLERSISLRTQLARRQTHQSASVD